MADICPKLPYFGKKKLGSKLFLCLRIFCVSFKNIGQKKMLIPKNLGPKKCWFPKSFGFKKDLSSEKLLG